MSSKKVQVKECDRDLKPTPATSSVQFTYLGTTYELDLCEKHAHDFDREMAGWTRVAREVQAPSNFADTDRWHDLLDREDQHRKDAQAQLIDEDPDWVQPPYFNDWELTDHARERMLERGFTERAVLAAATTPTEAFVHRQREGYRYHHRGQVTVVVDVRRKAVVTVMFRFAEDYATYLLKTKEKASAHN